MKEEQFCPKCKSSNVTSDGSMIEFSAGAMLCKQCGYKSARGFPIKVKQKKKLNKK